MHAHLQSICLHAHVHAKMFMSTYMYDHDVRMHMYMHVNVCVCVRVYLLIVTFVRVVTCHRVERTTLQRNLRRPRLQSGLTSS